MIDEIIRNVLLAVGHFLLFHASHFYSLASSFLYTEFQLDVVVHKIRIQPNEKPLYNNYYIRTLIYYQAKVSKSAKRKETSFLVS